MNSEIIKKKILLVEDDHLTAMVQKWALEKFGYNVITANTGQKAIELFNTKNDIGLILMDIDLGSGINGPETAKILLKEHVIPIVFLSSHTEPELVNKTEKITSYGYVVKNSGITVLDASIKMAYKLFSANQMNLQKEDRYRFLVENLDDVIFTLDQDGNITYVTPQIEQMAYYSVEEVIGRNFSEFVHPDDVSELKGLFNMALEGRHGPVEIRALTKDSLVKSVSVSSNPIQKDGAIIGVTLLMTGNFARRKAEDAVLESEEKFRSIIEQTGDFIAVIDDNGIITYASPSSMSHFYYEPDEMCGRNLTEFIDKQEIPKAVESYTSLLENGEVTKGLKLTMKRKDGTTFSGELSGSIFRGETPDGILVVIRDITYHKQAEETIQNLLHEKELLLKEVHHRIKNNMNTIKGILYLHGSAMIDSSASAALHDAEGRIHSMMMLYDKLYCSHDFREMPVKAYLLPLIDEIIKIFPNYGIVRVNTDIQDFILGAKILFPLGIIVNELLTNIMKHAFTGRDSGAINVSAFMEDKQAVIILSDDGKGIPEPVNLENSKSFGLNLIRMLTTQIGGSIQIEQENGLKYIFKFDA